MTHTNDREEQRTVNTFDFAILGLDVVMFIISNTAAVVWEGQTSVKLLVVILYICFSIGSGSGLDVFQIPQHRKALFVRL